MQKQASIITLKHAGNMLVERNGGTSNSMQGRRERIWMDNLQEIRQKLAEQTRRYEDIFKNEFVLTILKSCETCQGKT